MSDIDNEMDTRFEVGSVFIVIYDISLHLVLVEIFEVFSRFLNRFKSWFTGRTYSLKASLSSLSKTEGFRKIGN